MQPAQEGGTNRRVLFFSRSRSDLGLTLIFAAGLSLLTVVLFKLDDDVQLVVFVCRCQFNLSHLV